MRYLLFLITIMLAAPACADDLQDRSQLIFNCINTKGTVLAAQEQPSGCVGLLRDPCIASLDVFGDAQLMDCVGGETEAWDKLLNDVYNEARQTQLTADFNALRDRQRAWLKSRDKICALPEGFGTSERLQGFNCFLEETSKRVAVLNRELKLVKK
jgi:uncharacterized protein YecT (DUF1311 family)